MTKSLPPKSNDFESQSFEHKLIIRSLLVGSIASLAGAMLNFIFGLNLITTLIALAGSAVYFFFYYTLPRISSRKIPYWSIIIFTGLFLNTLWIFNNRSEGPILYLLIVFYLLVLLLSTKTRIVLVSIVALINLFVLFYVDYLLPMETLKYPDKLTLLLDNYMGVFFALFIVLAMVAVLKNHYFKELIHAQESDKLKSAFLANLSHEIRTPLNAVIGFSSLINDGIEPEEREEFVQLIRENGNQLTNLVDQLIILSKFESGTIKMQIQELNLSKFLEELFNDYDESAQEKGIVFDYILQGDETIQVDINLLTIVMKELLSNAIKFSNFGKIRIGAVNRLGKCKFFVKDQGIGIQQEDIDKIFDRFIKIEKPSSKLVRGTGVGLSLAKMAVQEMGGNLMVKSTYKKGTIFYFTIPASKVFSKKGMSS